MIRMAIGYGSDRTVPAHNNRLQRTAERHRGRAASAPFILRSRCAGQRSMRPLNRQQTEAAMRWKDEEFEAADVPVHIDEWTKPHAPAERADSSAADRMYDRLSEHCHSRTGAN